MALRGSFKDHSHQHPRTHAERVSKKVRVPPDRLGAGFFREWASFMPLTSVLSEDAH